MSKRQYPTDVIRQAQSVVNGWNQITPPPAFGAFTSVVLTTEVHEATTLEAQIQALEAQLADKRALRDAQFKALWEKVKRARNSIKGSYGDDSAQYKMVGGTRLSDRKPARRKTTE